MKTLLLAAAMLAGPGSALAQTVAPPAPPPPGPVTRAEAQADADRRFAAMDADHDGKVTPDERRALREARQQNGGPGAGHGGWGGREGRKGRESGDWTQADFRERALRRFDRVDTNRDGTIDPQEREAARLLMRSRMAERQQD